MSTITIGDFVIGANGEGVSGWSYNSVTDWYSADQDQLEIDTRPGQDGSFSSEQSYSSQATPSVSGVFVSNSAREVAQAKLKLRGLKSSGRLVPIIWDDHGVITRRMAYVSRVSSSHSASRPGFKWAIDMLAVDPTLYGPLMTAGPVGPPSRGEGGLRFDQYTGTSFEWVGLAHLSQSVQRVEGVETRRNHATNPSFEVDTANWYAGSGISIERALNVGSAAGVACARVTRLDGANDRIGTQLTGLTVGQVYRATAWIKQDGSPVNVTMVVDGNTLSAPQATTASFVEMNFQFTATVATTNLEMAIYPGAVTGAKFLIDTLRVEKFSTIANPSYFDGATPGTGRGPGLVFPETYGTEGSSGRITMTNEGGSDSYPLLRFVGGSSGGFILTRVSTGETIELLREVPLGSVVLVNPRTGRATIDGDNDISGSLRRADWWAIPPMSTEQVQLAIIGSTYGTPTLSADYARAD
jgi:hypothetical protein